MSEPILDATTEAVYARLPDHFRRVDINQDYAFKRFISGICKEQDVINTLVQRFDYTPPDEGGVLGDTSELVDPRFADEAWLPWLAQLIGVNLSTRVVDLNTRNELLNASNGYLAGTDSAIISAVQTELVGTKSVRLKKRTTSTGVGGAWDLLIQTLSSETLMNILPSSIIVPSSVRNYEYDSVPTGEADRVQLQIIKDTKFYRQRALQIQIVPVASGIGAEGGELGYGLDDYGLDSFGVGDSEETEATEFYFYTPFYFPIDDTDPLTTMVDISFESGTNDTITISAGIELYHFDGTNYTEVEYVGTGDVTIAKDGIHRFLGRSESVGATVTHGRFYIDLTNVGSSTVVHVGHFGARKENNNLWVPRSADPVQAVIDRGAKPAGLKLWHTYTTSSWDALENGGTTTWNDLEALPTWVEVEEFDP